MIIISIPGHRARNFNNRTTAWMWLRRMRPHLHYAAPCSTEQFMQRLDEFASFSIITKAGEALITQERA